jgi:hypothetical protein
VDGHLVGRSLNLIAFSPGKRPLDLSSAASATVNVAHATTPPTTPIAAMTHLRFIAVSLS